MSADFSKYFEFDIDSKSIKASCIWFYSAVSKDTAATGDCAYPIPVFNQNVVVTANGYQKEHDLDVVENVYPFLPLRSLTTNIDHFVYEVAQLEDGLGDTGRPQSCAQNVLVCGKEVFHEKAVDVLEEAVVQVSLNPSIAVCLDLLAQVVVQRILVAFQDGDLHALVGPQSVERVKEVLGHRLLGADVWRRVDHLRVTLQAPKSAHLSHV